MLIPCAGNIAIDMQAEFGPIPAALLPVGKEFALIETLRPVASLYSKILVGFSSEQTLVQASVDRSFGNVNIVNVGPTKSLGETILGLLKSLPPQTTSICVQMGDAFHAGVKRDRDTVYYSMENSLNRWVSFQFDSESGLHNVEMPGTSKSRALGTAFAGKFEFEDAPNLRTLLESEITSTGKTDPFYRAVVRYFNSKTDRTNLLVESPDWIDFGYSSSYFDYRRKVGFNSRSFNSLRFNEKKKSVTKRSANQAKFSDEVSWYANLPNDLADLYPRIYAESLVPGDTWIETEYSVALPIDQLFMYSKLDIAVWQRIFAQVEIALERFRQHRPIPLTEAQLHSMCKTIYLTKTLERLESVMIDARFKDLHADGLQIDGVSALGLSSVVERLPVFLERFLADFKPIASVLHGDLCFSNILYDHRLDHVRLIDPRGSFGAKGVFGDLRYDLAKLRHSAKGNYDFIVNEHFVLSEPSPRNFELRILNENSFNEAGDMVDQMINKLSDKNGIAVRFIEALLFLSMVPLHEDRAHVQRAFLISGLRKFSESVREMGW